METEPDYYVIRQSGYSDPMGAYSLPYVHLDTGYMDFNLNQGNQFRDVTGTKAKMDAMASRIRARQSEENRVKYPIEVMPVWITRWDRGYSGKDVR